MGVFDFLFSFFPFTSIELPAQPTWFCLAPTPNRLAPAPSLLEASGVRNIRGQAKYQPIFWPKGLRAKA